MPPAYRRPPTKGEIVESLESGFARLQDWAFTHCFALVIESASSDRTIYRCTHHQKKTQNTRKTAEDDCKRVETHTQARRCPFSIYISKQKRLGNCQAIGFNLNTLEHNHAPNPDPFIYLQHRSKRPGYTKALDLASTLYRTVGYTPASEILKKKGQEIDWKQFYNLLRKENKGSLTKHEELLLLLKVLDDKGLYPQVRKEYTLDKNSNRTQHIICNIFQISSEQIRIAQQFVSNFMYKTNATFNTNVLYLLLSVIVGIDNTSSTFLVAYCYITLESAAAFKWISKQLTELCFSRCPKPKLIVGDFSKGLRVAVAAKATADLARVAPTNKALQLEDLVAELEAVKVIVSKAYRKPQPIKLQLCKQHTVEAIKRKLVAVGWYKKER